MQVVRAIRVRLPISNRRRLARYAKDRWGLVAARSHAAKVTTKDPDKFRGMRTVVAVPSGAVSSGRRGGTGWRLQKIIYVEQ